MRRLETSEQPLKEKQQYLIQKKNSMKKTNTRQQLIEKAGRDFWAQMWARYQGQQALGQDVTEDDEATKLEAEILATGEAVHLGSTHTPKPFSQNQPHTSSEGVVVPFPQNPPDLPLSA